MTQILNVWKSKPLFPAYYSEANPIEQLGDYKVYHQFADCYLYTHKNIAISQLAGHNKKVLHILNGMQTAQDTQTSFLINRMRETQYKGVEMAQQFNFAIA